MTIEEINNLFKNYNIKGRVIAVEPFGNGRINKTFKITTINDAEHHYILQQINTSLFKNVDELMKNINLITNHIRKKIENRNGDVSRETLSIVKTKNENNFSVENGYCFRIYEFIENSVCKDKITSIKEMEELGMAFGQFHKDLSDFDVKQLFTTIPDFHNTLKRFNHFITVCQKDELNRTQKAMREIKFINKNKKIAGYIFAAEKAGILPLRAVHNDTKLNNVLFDNNTKKIITILDLDTVMPNTLCYDFGDAVRYACNSASEDEKNLSKVKFNLEYFKAFTTSYLNKTSKILTQKEKEFLYYAPKTMAYELGLRFLTDFLEGDCYFKIKNKNDNLTRAKVQIKLARDIIRHESQIKEYIKNCLK